VTAKVAALGQAAEHDYFVSGQSVAVANVTGVIALLLSSTRTFWKRAQVSAVDVEERLKKTCLPMTIDGDSFAIEYGLLAPLKLLAH
jgi:hypothetical protein